MHDVIVSGSGPSGSLSAALLATRGHDVLMLEEAHHPRKKCCAGGLLVRAQRSIGAPLPERLVERRLKAVRLVRGKESVELRSDGEIALTIRRERFDQWLVDRAIEAGATLREGVEVRGAVSSGKKVVVETSGGMEEGRALLVADGALSKCSDRLFGKCPPGSIAMGGALEADCDAADDAMEIQLLSTSNGLDSIPPACAIFPKGSGCTVSFVARGVGGGRMQKVMKDALEAYAARHGRAEAVNTCFHPIPLAPRPRLVTGRCLALGDAAGFASPFSGEGLSNAMLSAVFAADSVHRALLEKNVSPLSRYIDDCHDNILHQSEIAGTVGRNISRLLNRHGAMRLARAAAGDSRLTEAYIGLLTGDASAEEVATASLSALPRMLMRLRRH